MDCGIFRHLGSTSSKLAARFFRLEGILGIDELQAETTRRNETLLRPAPNEKAYIQAFLSPGTSSQLDNV